MRNDKRPREPRRSSRARPALQEGGLVAFVEAVRRQAARLDLPGWAPDMDSEPLAPGGKVWTGKIYTGGGKGRSSVWCTYVDGEQTIENVEAICEIRNALPEILRLARIGANVEASKLLIRNALTTDKRSE